jgi:hypothetical protein
MNLEDFLRLSDIRKSWLFIKKFDRKHQPFILEMARPEEERDLVARLLYPQFPSSVCDGPLSFIQDDWARKKFSGIAGLKDYYVCEWHVKTGAALKELWALLDRETIRHTLWLSAAQGGPILSYTNEQAVRRSFLVILTLPDAVTPPAWEKEAELYLMEDSQGISLDLQGYRRQKYNNIWGSLLPYLQERAGGVLPFLRYVEKNFVPKETAGLFLQSLTGTMASIIERTYGNSIFSDIPYQFERYISFMNFDLIKPRELDEIIINEK